jgi:metal-responsive CopG/Arc/MetJ family transcriptional regulator
MGKSAKATISLPADVLRAVDVERSRTTETRRAFFKRAAERLLRQEKWKAIRNYIRGYQRYPETPEEVAVFGALAAEALADQPWEET